ncbi:MAG: hypothetical protein II161_03175 [Erysipelotrichaceae bacterium]|nr:hypothetical protein [Erysipelotrichaceae bacterium]
MAEEVRSHTVKVQNIPRERKLCSVTTKSREVIVISWSVFILLMLSKTYIPAIPVGVLALFHTCRKGRKLFEGYESFVAIYDENDQEVCQLIYHSETLNWETRIAGGNPYILLILDDEKIRIEKGLNRNVYRYFVRVMGEKEISRHRKKG